MRCLAATGLLLLSVVVFVGCETEEPTELKDRTVDLLFVGGGSSLPAFYGWSLFEDSNLDGIADGPISLYCEGRFTGKVAGLPCGATCGNPILGIALSTPWFFTTEVQVLKSGESFPRTEVSSVGTITSPTQVFDFENTNMTDYDSGSRTSTVSRSLVQILSPVFECSNSPIPCDPANPADACSAL